MHSVALDQFPHPQLPRNLWNSVYSIFNEYGYHPKIAQSENFQHLFAVNKSLTTGSIWKYYHLKGWSCIKENSESDILKYTITAVTHVNDKLFCFGKGNKIMIIDTADGNSNFIEIKDSVYDKIIRILDAVADNDKLQIICITKRLKTLLSEPTYDIRHQIVGTNGDILQLVKIKSIQSIFLKKPINVQLLMLDNHILGMSQYNNIYIICLNCSDTIFSSI